VTVVSAPQLLGSSPEVPTFVWDCGELCSLPAGAEVASTAARTEAGFARRGRSAEGFGNPSGDPINNRAVAPMVEQRSPKPRVVGSSPACPALESLPA
jgi:hypothetical protein